MVRQKLPASFAITFNREAFEFYRFCRIFFGKPASAIPENALAIGHKRHIVYVIEASRRRSYAVSSHMDASLA